MGPKILASAFSAFGPLLMAQRRSMLCSGTLVRLLLLLLNQVSQHFRVLTIRSALAGQYDEGTLSGLDFVMDEASKRGIRLTLVFINYWSQYGGVDQYNVWSFQAGTGESPRPVLPPRFRQPFLQLEAPLIAAPGLCAAPACQQHRTQQTFRSVRFSVPAYLKCWLECRHLQW